VIDLSIYACETPVILSPRSVVRQTYLTITPRRLWLLQDWAGQFRTYWGSDQASFENYRSYLDSDPRHP
jgi:hypothetical protein